MKQTIFFILFVQSIFAQKTYKIEILKDSLYAEYSLTNKFEEDGFKMGTVSVFETKKDIPFIQIDSIEMPFDFRFEDLTDLEIQEIPYENQSLVIYEDFNFDGNNDLALFEGNFGCYGGPSYIVYLFNENQFTYNQDFTDLVINNCGFFSIDKEKKQLRTFTKSGCCWHSYSTYQIVNNGIEEIERIEENATSFPLVNVLKYSIIQDSLQVTSDILFMDVSDQAYHSEILTFELEKNNQIVLIYNIGGFLNYVVLKNNEKVENDSFLREIEYYYPIEYDTENGMFRYHENRLTFMNKDIKYEIFQDYKKNKIFRIGVNVYQNNKKTVLKGKIETLKGDLNKLNELELNNLSNK